MQGEMGTVYVIVFERPVSGRVQTYCGWARNVEGRLWHHKGGTGARLTRAAVEQGIDFDIVWQMPGTRADERKLKNRKNMPKFLAQHGIFI